jgi:hypothetical protein
MLGGLLPSLALCAVINVSRLGYNELTISRTDLLYIDLSDKAAFFLELPAGELSAGYRSSRHVYTDYFPVSVREFSVAGFSINVRTTARRTRVRFWLLDLLVCPDLRNVAIVNTDRVLTVETRLIGPLCIFARLNGKAFRTAIGTGYGIPFVSFYSSRGRGEPIKTCRGEEDICTFEAHEPFFFTLRGKLKINLSYRADAWRWQGRTVCSILGIPTIRNGSFVDVSPKIANMGGAWCMSKENGLLLASLWMAALLIIGILVALLFKWHIDKYGLKRLRTMNNGMLCAIARQTYESCF